MTTTEVKFAGDENIEKHGKEIFAKVEAALNAAIPYIKGLNRDPMAVEQCQKALKTAKAEFQKEERECKKEKSYRRAPFIGTKNSLALVAALIVAENVVHLTSDSNNDEHLKIHGLLVAALSATGRRLVERGSHRLWVPVDIFVVAMDETEYWTLPDAWKDKVERVEGVYFFDKNLITHICSFSGSYFLEHLEDRVIFKDGVEDEIGAEAYDRLRDEAFEYMNSGPKDDSSNYFDETSIDSFLRENASKPFRVFHYGNPGFDWFESVESGQDRRETKDRSPEQQDEDGRWAIMEAVREHLQGNAVL